MLSNGPDRASGYLRSCLGKTHTCILHVGSGATCAEPGRRAGKHLLRDKRKNKKQELARRARSGTEDDQPQHHLCGLPQDEPQEGGVSWGADGSPCPSREVRFSPRHTHFGAQVNPHSHSAEPLPAAFFPGYFLGIYPELPMPTLSHNNTAILFSLEI